MIAKLVTAPANPAVTLNTVKGHLRIEIADTACDARLTPYLDASINDAESRLGRALITQTWDIIFSSWYELQKSVLPFGQLQSVASLKYFDADGVEQTVDTEDYYIPGLGTDDGRIIYEESPILRDFDPITVRIICGYGDDSTDVPAGVRAAIMLMVEEQETGVELEKTITRLLRPNRLQNIPDIDKTRQPPASPYVDDVYFPNID